MKLSEAHLDALNTKFPPGYLLEPIECPVKRRRNEVEILQLSSVPAPLPRPAKVEVRLPDPDLHRPLLDFLAKLKAHPQACQFDDSDICSLQKIEERVRNAEFEGMKQLAAEVRRMWQTALSTYAKGCAEYMAAIDLSSYTETLLKPLELHRPKVQVTLQLPPPPPMTFEEKKALSFKIRSLDPKYLRGIYDIVKGSLRGSGQEMEFDLDALPASVCRGLAEYVDICARKTQSLQVSNGD